MRKLLVNSLFRTIIIVIIVSLLLAGAVYAYQTIWSGKGHIEIVAPLPAAVAEFEVTAVTTDANGEWNAATNTWAASIARGESTRVTVHLKNISTGSGIVRGYINGEGPNPTVMIIPNVYIRTSGDLSLVGGESGSVTFTVNATTYAQIGTLPEVELELRGPFLY